MISSGRTMPTSGPSTIRKDIGRRPGYAWPPPASAESASIGRNLAPAHNHGVGVPEVIRAAPAGNLWLLTPRPEIAAF
jgi:hypothetical protein